MIGLTLIAACSLLSKALFGISTSSVTLPPRNFNCIALNPTLVSLQASPLLSALPYRLLAIKSMDLVACMAVYGLFNRSPLRSEVL